MASVIARVMARHRRLALAGMTWLAAAMLSGCALPPPQAQRDAGVPGEFSLWRGRLALRIDSEPAQSFSAGFELSGRPAQGELLLFSPLGTTLGQLRWSPQSAVWTHDGQTQSFNSVEALALQATGAALPVTHLFGWLDGQASPVPGWMVDLSQREDGRLIARRSTPIPTVELRLVLER